MGQRGDGAGKSGWTDLPFRLICFWRAWLCGKGKAAPGSTAVSPSRFIDSLISKGASRAVSSADVEHPAALHSIKAS